MDAPAERGKVAPVFTDLRRSLRFYWYRTDKVVWAFAIVLAMIITTLVLAMQAVIAQREARRAAEREAHRQSLACLARNVYYEARGEPVAGQFAVAEVTMNRKASKRYRGTVCEVVHQKNWDPIRKRYVGAFSWTEFDVLPEPEGEEWERALKIAEAVYYRREPPALKGAMYYHADYILPSWAKEKKPVARIGRHIFYR